MVLLKRLLLWSICLHGLILITFAHSGGFLFMLDLAFLSASTEFFDERNFNPFTLDIIHNIGFVVTLSFLGKLFTVIALFIKRKKRFFILSFIGLIQLWLSFFYLAYDFRNNNEAYTAFITGLPFLILSILFILFSYMQWKNQTVRV